MNRTFTFLGLAAGLAVLALVLGLPKSGVTPPPKTEPTTVVVNPTAPSVRSDGSLSFQARLSHPYVPAGASDVFVTVDVTGVEVPGQERAAVNLALVLDRSGSMSGEKLDQAKLAAKALVRQLGDKDRLAIVHYGSEVKFLASAPTTAAEKERMLAYIDGIWDDGGTNIGDGLRAGASQVQKHLSSFKVNRIILISDGQPTEGVTDEGSLSQIARDIRQGGVAVSSIGVGTDFNEDLMQRIAELGSGAYGFLEDASKLAGLFQKDLSQAGKTVARNVTLSFELPSGVKLGEVLGYQAEQVGTSVRVFMPDFSAGQVERVVARVTVQSNTVGKAADVSGVKLTYRDLLKEGDVTSSALLTAMVTDKQEEVVSRRDKEAFILGTRATSAKNTQLAADAMKKGDRQAAKMYLQSNRVLLDDVSNAYGAGAVAGDLQTQQQISDGFEAASAPAEVEAAVKASKSQARKDFGRMGSTY